jgi:hypothetical protein
MATLTLNKAKTKAYDASRKWADGYDPMMNQIACNIIFNDPKLISVYFLKPTDAQDRKLGTDKVITVSDIRMSYRIREYKYKPYFLEGFTIRTSGIESELYKIMNEDRFASFLLYACADEEKYGEVDSAVLVDLKVLGAYLKQNPAAIEQAYKGSGFISFKYDELPSEVIAGLWNLKRKGE